MGFDKAIASGKEHRKPYTHAKAVDITCRNHGSCDYCRSNRTFKNKRAEEESKDALNSYLHGGIDGYY